MLKINVSIYCIMLLNPILSLTLGSWVGLVFNSTEK